MLIPKYYFNATSNRTLKIISKKQDVRNSDTVIILRGAWDEPYGWGPTRAPFET